MGIEGLELTEAPEEAPEQVEAVEPAKDEAEAEEAQPTPEQELERIRAENADLNKRLNDLKSQQIGRQRAQERDEAVQTRLDRLSESIATNNESVLAILEHLASGEGDPEKLKTKLGTIQSQTKDLEAKQQALAQFEQSYQDALKDMNGALSDGKGGLVLQPDAPELDEAAKAWNAARQNQDPVGLQRAIRLAERAVNQKLREQQSAPEPKRDRKNDLEMAIPKGTGASTVSDEELYRRMGDPNANLSQAEMGRVRSYMQKHNLLP